MALIQITPPRVPALRYEQAAEHLRLDDDPDDKAYVGALIAAAVGRVDGDRGVLGRALITQTWELVCDAFPRAFLVPLPPTQTVEQITYIDTDGNQQTVDPAVYQVDTDSQPARVVPLPGQSWPATQSGIVNTVRLRFIAGFGDAAADVPMPIRQAIALWVANLYVEREPVGATQAAELPMSVTALLFNYQQQRF